jgi:hypothetical protein
VTEQLPVPQRTERLRLVAHFPGRLRVRSEAFRTSPQLADDVIARLREEPGVREASASRLTGSLLVLYEPCELQLPTLVQLLVQAGGLAGIEVDANDAWAALPSQGARVREGLGGLNDSLRAFSAGKIDMRTAVPGTLAATGAAMFLAGRRRIPEWYDLLFWAFVTFTNMNRPDEQGARAHADVPRS